MSIYSKAFKYLDAKRDSFIRHYLVLRACIAVALACRVRQRTRVMWQIVAKSIRTFSKSNTDINKQAVMLEYEIFQIQRKLLHVRMWKN